MKKPRGTAVYGGISRRLPDARCGGVSVRERHVRRTQVTISGAFCDVVIHSNTL